MKLKKKLTFILCTLTLSSSCAVLHHVQVGDIDTTQKTHKKIDIKLSETGINSREMDAFARGLRSKEASQALAILELFQMGPRTGNPVFNENYASYAQDLILGQCPTGQVTNLSSIRESAKYPIVSGEIIKITGTCLEQK